MGKHIDQQFAADVVTEGLIWARPESARQPSGFTPEAEAFQRTMWALDCWPTDDPTIPQMTAWDVRMITAKATDESDSEYLQRLARF